MSLYWYNRLCRRQMQQCLVQHVWLIGGRYANDNIVLHSRQEGKWRQGGSSTQVGKGPHGCVLKRVPKQQGCL